MRLLLLLACLAASANAFCCRKWFLRHYNVSSSATGVKQNAKGREAHVTAAMQQVPATLLQDPSSLRLEFGVRNGEMMRHMASSLALPWDGFDSFRGLPPLDNKSSYARSRGWVAGKFSTKGVLPVVPSHVRLHKGWFDATLPPFLASAAGRGAVAFAHLDADLYSSTISVLRGLCTRCRLRVGTVLSFDEIFGDALGSEMEEMRALLEAASLCSFSWRWVTYLDSTSSHYGRAAVQVTAVSPRCDEANDNATDEVIPAREVQVRVDPCSCSCSKRECTYDGVVA